MYDEIASLYHLIYPDWDDAIKMQSRAYFDVATHILDGVPDRVLDVSCGIGTQALGLAGLGCKVVASDLSPGAVARARQEAEDRGVSISFEVSDMTDCFRTHGGDFDVVLSADNSVPHLRSDDVKLAVANMRRCLRPGGLVLIGIRDYQPHEQRSTGQVFSYGTREFGKHRYVIFQTRDWKDNSYDVGMYFVREMTADSAAEVVSGKSRYHAIAVDDLISILQDVGFEQVQRHDDVTHNVVLSGIVSGA